jgi:hypothetical protein
MRYYGYSSLWWGSPKEREDRIKAMRQDHANSQGCNFTWLSGVMTHTSGTKEVEIDTSQSIFKEFPEVLASSEKSDYPLFVGNITCTNFHEYPDWYVKLNPGLYVTTAKNSSTSLLYEKAVSDQQKRGWSAIDNANLNHIKRKFSQNILKYFGKNSAIKAWCMDGESLYPPNMPVDDVADYGSEALLHFRAWLQRKYRTIESLNAAWETVLPDFSAVNPPREKQGNAASVDWNLFRCQAMAEYVQQFYAIYRFASPQTPALVWQHDVQFRDYERFVTGQCVSEYARVGDGIQANPIIRPPHLEYNIQYFRAMTSFNKPVISKEASYYPRPWPPENVRMQLFEMLGMGLWATHLCEWDWGAGDIDWGIQGFPTQTAARAFFGMMERYREPLANMWPLMPSVRIYISDVKWLMDGWQPAWNQLQYDLISSQYSNLYIFDWQLENSIYWPPLIISVANSVVEQRAAENLERYVRGGGTLVLIDEFQKYDQRIKPGATLLSKIADGEHKLGAGRVIRIHGAYSAAAFKQLEELMDFGHATPWVRLTKQIASPARLGLELFPLSNGVDHAIVVVNTNNQSVSVQLELDPLLLGANEYSISTADMGLMPNLTWGQPIGMVGGSAGQVSPHFTVGANDGEILFVKRKGSTSEDVAKLQLSSRLQLTASSVLRKELKIEIRDAEGHAVDAVIDAKLIPLFDSPLPVEPLEKGSYRLRIPENLPMVYDYDKAEYVAPAGPIKIRVNVWAPQGEGEMEVALPNGSEEGK